MWGAIPWYLGLLSWRLFNKTARNKDDRHRCKQGRSLTMGRRCPHFLARIKVKTVGIPLFKTKRAPNRGVCQKFATMPKHLPLTKNLHYCSDQADIQPISPTHELMI